MPVVDVGELPKLDESLLPDYQKWRVEESSSTRGFWDYLSPNANHEIAAAFSKLFWPEFIEVEGLILLAEMYPKLGMTAEEFKQTLVTNPGSIEYTVNHLDIPYMYQGFGWATVDGELTHCVPTQLYDYLARSILFSWKHALKVAYPDREFVCEYDDDPRLANYRIYFFQRKWVEPRPNENSATG